MDMNCWKKSKKVSKIMSLKFTRVINDMEDFKEEMRLSRERSEKEMQEFNSKKRCVAFFMYIPLYGCVRRRCCG